MTNIIVWHGKHGDAYYDASTPEAKEAASIEILKEWLGYWQFIREPDEPYMYGIDMDQANLTDEQIDALPTDSLKEEARKHKARLSKAQNEFEREITAYRETKDFVENGTPVMYPEGVRRSGPNAGEVVPAQPMTAWQVLQQFTGGEYQEVEEVSVWTREEANA